jgi:hypothetical protein
MNILCSVLDGNATLKVEVSLKTQIKALDQVTVCSDAPKRRADRIAHIAVQLLLGPTEIGTADDKR